MGVLSAGRLFSLQKLSFSPWFPLFASLLTGAIVAVLFFGGFLDALEMDLYDWRFAQRWDIAPSNEVAVVFVNDATLLGLAESAGRWPWSRDVWAAFQQEILNEVGVKCSIYDIVFDLPDEDAANDRAFADTIRSTDNVLLACMFRQPELQADEIGSRALPRAMRRFALSLPEEVRESLSRDLPDYAAATLPLPSLLEAASGCGAPTYHRDTDGVLRRFPLIHRYGGEFYPSLPLLAAARHLQVPLSKIRVVPGESIVLPLDSGELLRIPINLQGQMLINFRSAALRALPSVNFVTAWRDYPEWKESASGSLAEIAGRTVLIGSIAEGTEDILGIPLAKAYPGTYMVATVVDNIIEGDFLRETGWKVNLFLILVNALLVGIWSAKLRPVVRLAVTVLQAVLFLQADVWLFKRYGICVPITSSTLAIALPFVTILLLKYSLERNARRYAERLFGKYLDSKIVEDMIRHPEVVGLGGVTKQVTILFSDLCGFTSISEKLNSEQVVEMLNEYFQEMSEAVVANGGMVDRYSGDAVMVLFGLPSAQADDALRAIRCGLEMLERIEKRKQSSDPGYFSQVNIRIGINTGDVTAGNIGSERQQQYTVIGDAVNLAERLEALAPTNGILISSSTYHAAGDRVNVKALGGMQVKGKQAEVQAYQVLGLKDAAE